MQRKEIIQLAEKLGLLYSEVDYNHPQHQRLISKLEKFAEAIEKKIVEEQEDAVESALRDLINLSKENQVS